MECLETNSGWYFTETEASEKMGTAVRIDCYIGKRFVTVKGMITRIFRVTNSGFCVLFECLELGVKNISQPLNKIEYEGRVTEESDPVIDAHLNGVKESLLKFLAYRWTLIT